MNAIAPSITVKARAKGDHILGSAAHLREPSVPTLARTVRSQIR